MSKTFLDLVTDEMEAVLRVGMHEIFQLTVEQGTDTLTRKFAKLYPELSVEELVTIQDALGHKLGESEPCKACKITARKEFELAED